MAKYLAEFASGPLDRYRKIASFDWKKMKIFIESEDFIEYQVCIQRFHLFLNFLNVNFSIDLSAS